MDDLIDRLAALRPANEASTPSTVAAADLQRGRQALGRRRARIGGTAAAAALAIAGTGLYLTAGGSSSSHDAASGGQTVGGIKLVGYAGPQASGYRIAEVPEGFGLALQASTPATLVIAKSGDTTSPDSFIGKIVISAEEEGSGSGGDQVSINGAAGTIRHSSDATTVEFPVRGLIVTVQSWNTIGLTDRQLIEFSDGITVTDAVQPVHG